MKLNKNNINDNINENDDKNYYMKLLYEYAAAKKLCFE